MGVLAFKPRISNILSKHSTTEPNPQNVHSALSEEEQPPWRSHTPVFRVQRTLCTAPVHGPSLPGPLPGIKFLWSFHSTLNSVPRKRRLSAALSPQRLTSGKSAHIPTPSPPNPCVLVPQDQSLIKSNPDLNHVFRPAPGSTYSVVGAQVKESHRD